MFQPDNPIPTEFATPLRKKQKFAINDREEERDHSQGRSSVTKSCGSPSTIASPRLYTTSSDLYFDLELYSVTLEEEETFERCPDYFESGYCRRGEHCESQHAIC
jgi:hypothetical protein